MIRFYKNLLKHQQKKIEALHNAQKWFREVTCAELADYFVRLIEKFKKQIQELQQNSSVKLSEINRKKELMVLCKNSLDYFGNKKPNVRPYENPIYWGAFVITGKME